ncbi:hypothetical protein GGX14DRAFT_562791 [Mycena pura]|uniref:Uncharacterized protein n=1 Tax=Mycena pura TaxID=153505 RepID=A0AAD6YJK1_9AGAR|nr:hypothetical protein GGX14DRAFT_562791 [Mycena pura]
MGMALPNAVVVAGRQFRQNGPTSTKHYDCAYLANDWYLSSGLPATPVAVIPGAICRQLVLFVLAPNQVALFSQLQNAAGVWLCDDIPAGLSFGCLTGLGWAHNMPRIMVPDWALPAWPTSGHTCSTSAKCPIYARAEAGRHADAKAPERPGGGIENHSLGAPGSSGPLPGMLGESHRRLLWAVFLIAILWGEDRRGLSDADVHRLRWGARWTLRRERMRNECGWNRYGWGQEGQQRVCSTTAE